MSGRYWIETLGCPKNQVDSDKVEGSLLAQGYARADAASSADLVVVNTCAFIDAAREESFEVIASLLAERRRGARLVVTGCLAAREGETLAGRLPDVDLVADVGVPVTLGGTRWRAGDPASSRHLLDLPRSPARAPWAYVKVAEGCDRSCGFCGIPAFRGRQVSRSHESILHEIDSLGVAEVVLVAQDLASFGADVGARGAICDLVRAAAARVARVRLLYLYPSALSDALVDAVLETGVPYFDLSLQHVSAPLVRRMRRYGNAARFLERIRRIRALEPNAVFRSSFILGYPGETEEDQDALLGFLDEADLDWVGFFPFSREPGTFADGLRDHVPRELALERLRECAEVQDAITARKRRAAVGSDVDVLIDAPGRARSYREAPEIDGIVRVDRDLDVGAVATVTIGAAEGVDLVASRTRAPVGAR